MKNALERILAMLAILTEGRYPLSFFMRPRITVLMPVWNGEKYLSEALTSILGQSFTDFELIVVDDGSTDSTSAILASCQDPRLRVFRLDHAGIVTALNYGIAHARAEWIARQDADDISHPDRLMKQWEAVTRNPRAVLCHTDVDIHGEGSVGITFARFPRSTALVALKLCFQCPIIHSSVMFRKSAVICADGYRAEERHAEDFGLWGRLLEHGDFIGLPDRLLNFRIHSESISHQKRETQLALTRKIAVSNCSRFMKLDKLTATRAHAILGATPSARAMNEWLWFLSYCVPRLRWHSAELYAWLTLHTLRSLSRARSLSRPATAI